MKGELEIMHLLRTGNCGDQGYASDGERDNETNGCGGKEKAQLDAGEGEDQ